MHNVLHVRLTCRQQVLGCGDGPKEASLGARDLLLVGEDNVIEYMVSLGNNIGALPFSALIDKNGKVLKTHQCEWTESDVEKAIRAAL